MASGRVLVSVTGMKQIVYAGRAIITGDAVAAALLHYAMQVAQSATAVTVDIPVLEANGKQATHTLLLGPATQFDVSDVDGLSEEESTRRFPVPEFPPIGQVGASRPSADFDAESRELDDMVADVENSLDR